MSALAAMPTDREPARTRDAIYRSIGSVQFSDVILEVDAATNFSDVLPGHRARSQQELLALYGALLAHGTELDASDVALMIPGLEYAQALAAMRSMESAKRLRRANERVVQYQSVIPLAALWGGWRQGVGRHDVSRCLPAAVERARQAAASSSTDALRSEDTASVTHQGCTAPIADASSTTATMTAGTTLPQRLQWGCSCCRQRLALHVRQDFLRRARGRVSPF